MFRSGSAMPDKSSMRGRETPKSHSLTAPAGRPHGVRKCVWFGVEERSESKILDDLMSPCNTLCSECK
eukprot:scaffold18613_cov112-Isochrysis_galbana.AAC.8